MEVRSALWKRESSRSEPAADIDIMADDTDNVTADTDNMAAYF